MIGWLIDTSVVASLMAPNGAPSVKAWGQVVDEDKLFLSILTLAEYDKGIANLAEFPVQEPSPRAIIFASGSI